MSEFGTTNYKGEQYELTSQAVYDGQAFLNKEEYYVATATKDGLSYLAYFLVIDKSEGIAYACDWDNASFITHVDENFSLRNRAKIQEQLMKNGKHIGAFSKEMEDLSIKEMEKVLGYLEHMNTIDVNANGKDSVVLVWDYPNSDRVDFRLIDRADYMNHYTKIFKNSKQKS